ncbi:hypothetical protein CMO88_00910 [Candidatus Woesearchaeota archaeon]|nr:hypothetical protein [Candidatus Woesearchaeota archaeon]|tara:strand:+ start:11641 stop:12918 length:1278 start_codon:yes stop_codon:yes gene_type:complete
MLYFNKKMALDSRKIALLIGSIILTLVIIEGFLRIGGFVFLALQQADNELSESSEDYRILALGESTTANLHNGQGAWPAELEKILNNESPGMYRVFNEGRPGTVTTDILKNLEYNLDRYNPHMVITMMGTNDQGAKVKRKSDIFKKFRTYKLGKLIIVGLNNKFTGKSDSALAPEQKKQDYAIEKQLINVVTDEPDNIQAWMYLVTYYEERGDIEKMAETMGKMLKVAPNNVQIFQKAGSSYLGYGYYDEAEEALLKAISIDPIYYETHLGLGHLYTMTNRSEKAVQVLSIVIERSPAHKNEADELLKRISELRKNYYSPATRDNYQELYKILNKQGIKLVVMQYPTQKISEFEKLFTGNEKVLFVSNEENFRKALENFSYDELFVDRSRGSFGHATFQGNMLIAENVASAVLNEVSSEQINVVT